MSSVKRFGVVPAVVLLVGGIALTPPAAGATLGCGDTITASVTLTADVGPCPGDGLVVTASNVTIDLGGHSVSSVGRAQARTTDPVGIRLDHVSGVTVERGTVQGFAAGILIEGGFGNTVTAIVATGNIGFGFGHRGSGIDLDGTRSNQIIGNVATGNGPFAGIKIENNSFQNHIGSNSVTDNDVLTLEGQDAPSQQDDGISFDTGSSFNLADGNSASRNGEFGINMGGQTVAHITAIGNDIRDNGNVGVNAGAAGGHLVSGNAIDHNGYEQFRVPGNPTGFGGGVAACGTCFAPGDFTTFQRNVITNNNGPGVALVFNGVQLLGGTGNFGTFPPRPYTAPRSNLVQDNVITGNTGDGVFVECDLVYDANFNSTCITNPPPHQGMRILNNRTAANGGSGAGTSAWDLHDQNPNCDSDVWSGNTYQTANPPCTTAP